jgi:hypothetical protein
VISPLKKLLLACSKEAQFLQEKAALLINCWTCWCVGTFGGLLISHIWLWIKLSHTESGVRLVKPWELYRLCLKGQH